MQSSILLAAFLVDPLVVCESLSHWLVVQGAVFTVLFGVEPVLLKVHNPSHSMLQQCDQLQRIPMISLWDSMEFRKYF